MAPAFVPLKVTVLVPWVAPKLLPLMVTRAVGGAEFGDTLEPDTRPKETSVPPGAPAPVFPWDTCI